MTREELFLGTLQDLEQKVSSGNAYDILRTAGLLRQLLLDESSLVHQVKKGRSKKIIYSVADVNMPAGAIAWFLADGLDPYDCPPNTRVKDVDLSELLATNVIYSKGRSSTVKEVIRYASHVVGAIHAGTPTEEADIALSQLDNEFTVGGGQATIYSLTAITNVVLAGLKPLRQLIEAELG